MYFTPKDTQNQITLQAFTQIMDLWLVPPLMTYKVCRRGKCLSMHGLKMHQFDLQIELRTLTLMEALPVDLHSQVSISDRQGGKWPCKYLIQIHVWLLASIKWVTEI